MEFVGQLVSKLGEREGDSQSGHWKVAQYLLREVTMYPKNLVVDVRDDSYGKIEQFDALIGQNVKVQFDINANVYKGKDGQERWFNNVRAYRIKDVAKDAAAAAQGQAQQAAASDPFAQMEQNGATGQRSDDLPY